MVLVQCQDQPPAPRRTAEGLDTQPADAKMASSLCLGGVRSGLHESVSVHASEGTAGHGRAWPVCFAW